MFIIHLYEKVRAVLMHCTLVASEMTHYVIGIGANSGETLS